MRCAVSKLVVPATGGELESSKGDKKRNEGMKPMTNMAKKTKKCCGTKNWHAYHGTKITPRMASTLPAEELHQNESRASAKKEKQIPKKKTHPTNGSGAPKQERKKWHKRLEMSAAKEGRPCGIKQTARPVCQCQNKTL